MCLNNDAAAPVTALLAHEVDALGVQTKNGMGAIAVWRDARVVARARSKSPMLNHSDCNSIDVANKL
jgi:hypothetical protein